MLTTKGRVVSVVDVVNRDDGGDLLLLCEPDLTDKTVAVLRKHAIMDDVEFELEAGFTSRPRFRAPDDLDERVRATFRLTVADGFAVDFDEMVVTVDPAAD